MSLRDLEARLSYNCGDESISVFRRALDDCRDGRYAMRGRREQLLGDFVSTWQELEFATQQSQAMLTRLSSYSAIQRLSQVHNQAQMLSGQAVGTLASCIPTASNERQRDRAQYLLNSVCHAYDTITNLIMTMQSMRTQVEIATQHAANEDAVHKNYIMARVTEALPEDEGYSGQDMSRGPSMAREQSRRTIYEDPYQSTPRYTSSSKPQFIVDGDDSYGYNRQAPSPTESKYGQYRSYGCDPAVI